jgi:tetratricopeptide (TPR) repeat protein
MSGVTEPGWAQLARRYDLPNRPEWQKLLNHFDLSEGFALVVLLVTDADGAALCRHELEKALAREEKTLAAIELTTPADLRELPGRLLAVEPPATVAGLWMAAVEPDYSKVYPEWREAWQLALARLNSHRNPIRRQFNLSLVFVGAPWLQEVMREIAPDLWSVRTLVARIEPSPPSAAGQPPREAIRSEFGDERVGGDPVFALREAEKLRGVPGKELALARLLHRAGEGFAGRDDWRAAEKAHAEALELKQRAGAPAASLIATLNALAGTCLVLGQIHRSLAFAEQARKIARETGDQRGETNALNNVGLAYTALGNAPAAIEVYEQQLNIIRETGDKSWEAAALGNLGLAYFSLGGTRKAIEFYEQALVIFRQIQVRRGEANAFGNLGNAHAVLGDGRKAIELLERALVVYREIHDRRGEGTTLDNLGFAYYSLGDVPKAVEFSEQALVIAREIGDRHGEGNSLGNLGSAYLVLGDVRKASKFYEQQLKIVREIGDRRGEGSALYNSALALHSLGDGAAAVNRAAAALAIFEQIEDPHAAKVRAQLAKWRKAP